MAGASQHSEGRAPNTTRNHACGEWREPRPRNEPTSRDTSATGRAQRAVARHSVLRDAGYGSGAAGRSSWARTGDGGRSVAATPCGEGMLRLGVRGGVDFAPRVASRGVAMQIAGRAAIEDATMSSEGWGILSSRSRMSEVQPQPNQELWCVSPALKDMRYGAEAKRCSSRGRANLIRRRVDATARSRM